MEELSFIPSNKNLNIEDVSWIKIDDKYCQKCADRDGWMPRFYEDSCPECLGADETGAQFCGECEYCCGC